MSEAAEFRGFVPYRQHIIGLTSDLKKLKEYADDLCLNKSSELIDDVLGKIANDSFDIAIVGEFNRGKSTLINALLGKNILPTDILPCSATLNRVTYNVTPLVKIEYKDGRNEEIPIDKLPDYVTKLTEESLKVSETVKEATVYYPVNYCKNNVDIIDTPGLNDDENMTEVTLSVLPKVDAAIMVIMANSPFSEYERDFLENKLLTNDLGRVLFVVTRIDGIDDEDIERVLNLISDRIEKYILNKAEKTFGKDSDEFNTYRKKIGKPKVYGISAKKALKAKIKGDDEMLEESRFPAFEEALEKFLTEDRGAVVLQVPINRILSTSTEILKAIEMRENALAMKKEEFTNKYNNSLNDLETIRQRKLEEMVKINNSSSAVFNKLQPMIDNFWPEIKEEAVNIISNTEINAEDLKKENIEETQMRIFNIISNAAKQTGQDYSEKIQIEIEKSLDKEFSRLQDFESFVSSSMDNIQGSFSSINTNSNTGYGNVIGTTLISLTSFGGAFNGYKTAGVKGALVGEAAGLGAIYFTTTGLGLLLGALGLSVTWPVAITCGLVSAITGTFTGKKVAQLVFPDRKIDRFREQMKDAVSKKFDEMQFNSDFSANVKKQVESAFDALKNKVESETEAVLKDTENTLNDLLSKIERENVLTEQEKEKLKSISDSTAKIRINAENVSRQIAAVLDK